jgi:NAD(P)H-hydrate epimerase
VKLVTADQMRAIEADVFASGVTQPSLMEAAGRAVAHAISERLGGVRAQRLLVLVGGGNNGGDGLVAARYLHDDGADVRVYLLTPRSDADSNLAAVKQRDIEVVILTAENATSTLTQDLARADAVLDAILGIGASRPLEGVIAATMDALAHRRCPLFAVDIPTGVNADTGDVDPHAPTADVTFALGYSKLGLNLLPGSVHAGEVEVLDIGIAPALGGALDVEMLTPEWAGAALPERPLVSNKGSFGRVLVVAGSENYVGAATLSCLGALRAGAGLVTLASRSVVRAAVAAQLPEVTFLALPEEDGDLAPTAGDVVLQVLPAYDVLLIGPGMGQSAGSQTLVRGLLTAPAIAETPVVADADALNALSRLPGWHERLTCRAVLTPHPGELSRLAHSTIRDIQAGRLDVARDCATSWNQVLVLKGAQTVVADGTGAALISPFANPALATAGTGDVLAGCISGLVAQGTPLFIAAGLGVYLHGAAGELYADDFGPSGLLASELGAGIALSAASLRREQ